MLPSTSSAPLLLAAEYDRTAAALWQTPGAQSASASASAMEMLSRSDAVRKTRELAAEHAQAAADSLGALPNSETRDALLVLCYKILTGSPIK